MRDGPGGACPGSRGASAFEFQRLHGMGEALYELYTESVRPSRAGAATRIYAPVGSHEDLLAYLVRRLLENGANSSFVNRIADPAVLKVIAVLEPRRFAAMPNVPTLAETLPGFRKAPSWIGYLAPAGLPRPLVERINTSVNKAWNAPEVKKFFDDNGAMFIGGSADEFAASVKRDIEVTAALVKKIGIQPE